MNHSNLQEKVSQVLENQRDEIAQTLSALVQIASVTGEEGGAQKHVQQLYSNLGLRVVAFEPDIKKLRQHKEFAHPDAPDDKYKNRPDVLGIYEGSPSAKSLKLNGHIDVVTPEPIERWKLSPWSGKVLADRVCGRGAGDNKSGIIANYFALKGLLDAGIKPEGTVILESAVEEEDGGAGTLAALLEGYTADGLIVTDSGPAINVALSGLNYCKVRVKGRSIHAGWAELGVSAILKMNKICQVIAGLDEKRGRELKYPLFTNAGKKLSCNLVISTYHAGDYRASVPDWAEIQCRIGSIPGETTEGVRAQFEETIRKTADSDEWLRENPPEITWIRAGSEPWEQDPNHPFVQTFKACADRVAGRDVLITGMSAGADARFAKYYDIPALLTGTRGVNAHAANEYVDLDSLVTLSKVLAHFIMEWCGVAGS